MDKPYLFLRNGSRDIGTLIKDCLLGPHGRDLKIVCQDGTVHWNSVLMAMWSEVARKLFEYQDNRTRGTKIVMMLPETKIATIKPMLDLSITGQVMLPDQAMVDDVTSLISTLGMKADLSLNTEKHYLTSGNKHSKESKSETAEECLADIAIGGQLQADYEGEGLSFNNNHNGDVGYGGSKIVKVKLEKNAPIVSTNLSIRPTGSTKVDVADGNNFEKEHFGESEKTERKDKDNGPNLPGRSKPDSVTNKIVDNNRIPKICLEPLNIKVPKEEKTLHPSNSRKIQCMLCDSTYDMYNKFIFHLTRKHYHQKLMSLFGADKSFCPFCNLKFALSYRDRDKSIHLAMVHKKIFAVANQTIKAKLQQTQVEHQAYKYNRRSWDICKAQFNSRKVGQACCSEFTSSPQELRFHLANTHYADRLVSVYGEADEPCRCCEVDNKHVAKDRAGIILHMVTSHPVQVFKLMSKREAHLLQPCLRKDTTYNDSNGLKCPLCGSSYGKPSLLKAHLSVAHYRNDVLNLANIGEDVTTCPDCGKSIGSEIKPNVPGMSKHLGLIHGYLDKVLPTHIKEELNGLGKHCKRPFPVQRALAQSKRDKLPNKELKAKMSGSKGSSECQTNRKDISTSDRIKNKLEQKTRPKLRTETPAAKIRKSKDPFCFVCHLCPLKFASPSLLKAHLAMGHYCKMILREVNMTEDETKQCPLCPKSLGPTNAKYPNDARRYLARHLGTMHGCLEKVLPDKEREMLYGQSAK